MPKKRAPRRPVPQWEHPDEPVFVRHPPVINHPPEAWHHQVPYPYRFKIDGGWIFIVLLAAGSVVFKPLLLLAGFIAFLRIVVWLCFRFPLTMVFFTAFFSGLFGGRRRRW
jgi:hypothetical protein